MMHTNSKAIAPAWSTLLSEAVTKPGLMLAAYNAFHSYSVGNQILAIVQLSARGPQPAPINTYPGWLSKGRQVKKGHGNDSPENGPFAGNDSLTWFYFALKRIRPKSTDFGHAF